MGIANRVINVLILVVAVIVVFFSFKLFEKREQLVKGWSIMAASINKTASIFDDESKSGTALAKELTTQKLSHENFATLAANVAKLEAEAAKLVEQRDRLAGSLAKVAEKLETPAETDAAELTKVSTSTDRQIDLLERVQKVQNRNDDLVARVVDMGKNIGTEVTAQDLKNSETLTDTMRKLNDSAVNLKTRNEKYDRHITAVAEVLELPVKPQLSGDDYEANLKTAYASVQDFKNTFDTTKKELEQEKRLANELKVQVEKKTAEIAAIQKRVAAQQAEIKKLKAIIDPEASAETGKELAMELPPRDVYKKLRGKVVYVSDKYGFVTVDLGSKSQITQKIGKAEKQVNAPLQHGGVLTVARDLASDKATFAGKVKVVKVNENTAVANILPVKGLVTPQVGDDVYFEEADIVSMLVPKKAAADAAAAPAAEAAVSVEVSETVPAEGGEKVEEAAKVEEDIFE